MNDFVKAARLTLDLQNARGRNYYQILWALEELIKDDFKADFDIIYAESGKITPVAIGVLSLRYNLNFKATCHMVCKYCGAPVDHEYLYDYLIGRGKLKVSQIHEAAIQRKNDYSVPVVSRYQEMEPEK